MVTASVMSRSVRAVKSSPADSISLGYMLMAVKPGRVLCNEVNTMPGFTAISMYPKLMEQEGLDFAALADRLIGLALSRRKGAY